jgi:hypothetical protein
MGPPSASARQNGDTLLLANDHVAEWPAVTDDDHPVDGVPTGCKRVSDELKIVDNEADAYAPGDIPLQRVVADPTLDVAVLKAHTALQLMPWKIGRSAAVQERNVVEVRGLPLGAFEATNAGKVISAYNHDTQGDWDHVDFVTDALLSPGNSGSPVLAVSCKTGEFELVGIDHACYVDGSALILVVGVDQLRGLMTTLKRSPRPKDVLPRLDASRRAALLAAAQSTPEPYFPFGPLAAAARVRSDGAVLFEVMPKGFPLEAGPLVVLEDLPPRGEEFGRLGRASFGNAGGLKAYSRGEADGETQGRLVSMLDGLRRDALAEADYQEAAREGDSSRAHFDEMSSRRSALEKLLAQQQELAQDAADLADRLAPQPPDTGERLAELCALPPSTPSEVLPRMVLPQRRPDPAAQRAAAAR